MADKNKKKTKMSKVLVYSIILLLIVTGLFWLNKKGEEFKNQKSFPSQKFSQTTTTDTKESATNQDSSKSKTVSKSEEARNTKEENQLN